MSCLYTHKCCPKKDWNDYPFPKALRPALPREIPVSLFIYLVFNASLFSESWKLLVGNVAIEICSLVSFGKGESWDCRSEIASINYQRQSGHDTIGRKSSSVIRMISLSEISGYVSLSIGFSLKSYLTCVTKIP